MALRKLTVIAGDSSNPNSAEKMFKPSYPTKEHQYGWWTEKVLADLVCRWHSQGGTNYCAIHNERMQKHLDLLIQEFGEEVSTLHEKAFKTISKYNV